MPTPESPSPYLLLGRKLLPYHGNIAQTGADVIVNTTGPTARLTNDLSRAITEAAGGEEVVRAYLRGLLPIREGTVAITPAGAIPHTRYIFHVVPTASSQGRTASASSIDKLTRHVIALADLLEASSIAIPPMGGGRGRGKKEEIVRVILAAAVDSLSRCQRLETLIFAATDPATYLHYHNHIVVALVLEQRRQEILALLPLLRPGLYSDVGRLLLQMDALQTHAAQMTDAEHPQLDIAALQDQVGTLAQAADELARAMPTDASAQAMRAIIATGQSIVYNIAIAQGEGAVAAAGGSAAVGGHVFGDIRPGA